eukprot:Clim_evm84s153 gene=Clim_evmTU84s153
MVAELKRSSEAVDESSDQGTVPNGTDLETDKSMEPSVKLKRIKVDITTNYDVDYFTLAGRTKKTVNAAGEEEEEEALEQDKNGVVKPPPPRKVTRKKDDDDYDTADSFIDDEENFDERATKKLTTKYGGFFVHSGELEVYTDEESEEESPTAKPKSAIRPRSMKKKGDDPEREQEVDEFMVDGPMAHLTKEFFEKQGGSWEDLNDVMLAISQTCSKVGLERKDAIQWIARRTGVTELTIRKRINRYEAEVSKEKARKLLENMERVLKTQLSEHVEANKEAFTALAKQEGRRRNIPLNDDIRHTLGIMFDAIGERCFYDNRQFTSKQTLRDYIRKERARKRGVVEEEIRTLWRKKLMRLHPEFNLRLDQVLRVYHNQEDPNFMQRQKKGVQDPKDVLEDASEAESISEDDEPGHGPKENEKDLKKKPKKEQKSRSTPSKPKVKTEPQDSVQGAGDKPGSKAPVTEAERDAAAARASGPSKPKNPPKSKNPIQPAPIAVAASASTPAPASPVVAPPKHPQQVAQGGSAPKQYNKKDEKPAADPNNRGPVLSPSHSPQPRGASKSTPSTQSSGYQNQTLPQNTNAGQSGQTDKQFHGSFPVAPGPKPRAAQPPVRGGRPPTVPPQAPTANAPPRAQAAPQAPQPPQQPHQQTHTQYQQPHPGYAHHPQYGHSAYRPQQPGSATSAYGNPVGRPPYYQQHQYPQHGHYPQQGQHYYHNSYYNQQQRR